MQELTNSDEQIDYQWHNRDSLPASVLEECARLFSNHYGTWSLTSDRPGDPISLSSSMLQKRIAPEGASISLAYYKGQLIGHAISLRREIIGAGWITWVTQLVVHTDWRNRGIATTMLNSIWGFSNDFAWGLVTASPFTVKALEKATRRRCDPRVIRKHLLHLREITKYVSYADEKKIDVTDYKSVIDTQFFIDHSNLKMMLKQSEVRRWKLGQLKEGQEWFAFTFRGQRPLKLTHDEIDSLFFERSEQILREAYSRMRLNGGHRWAQHAAHEIDWILRQISDERELEVGDFGCGAGRHVVECAKRGHSVTGVDFLPKLLDRARKETARYTNVTFVLGDCRDVALDTQFDIGLALYDVMGSFPKDEDNRRILENVSRHMRQGGLVVLSVMNFYLTKTISKYRGDVYKKPRLLEKLRPTNIMQQTGGVFDPEFYVLDENSRVVYRKEQFSEDGLLSAELVVRDRRYGSEEVVENCEAAGLETIDCRYVQAGAWDKPLEKEDRNAKEILYVGRKR